MSLQTTTDSSTMAIDSLGFDATAESEWDRFVTETQGSSFCHLSGWRRVLQNALNHKTEFLIVRDTAGHILAGLPLTHVRGGRLFGDQLVSMPFLSYGGPLGPPEIQSQLVKEAQALVERNKIDSFEIRSRHDVATDLSVNIRKLICRLELPENEEILWEKVLPGKIRTSVRRARKAGLVFRSGPGEIDAFYSVFCEKMRDLGTPVLTKRYFEEVLREFPELIVVGALYDGDTPVAGGFGFAWLGEFEITWAASLSSHTSAQPTTLLYWELMLQHLKRGGRWFNFGRSSPGSGTHRFKLSWGAEETSLPWISLQKSGGEVKGYDASPTMRFASSAWQRLPLPLANRIGPYLARFLP